MISVKLMNAVKSELTRRLFFYGLHEGAMLPLTLTSYVLDVNCFMYVNWVVSETPVYVYWSCTAVRFHTETNYRKIPKISLGAYIFQRPFLRGLFLQGLIFGWAYLRREICVSKSIGLALQLEVNLPFLLCFTLYSRAIFLISTRGAYIWRGDLTEGFLRHGIGGLYLEGLIFGILGYSTMEESFRPLYISVDQTFFSGDFFLPLCEVIHVYSCGNFCKTKLKNLSFCLPFVHF